MGKNFLIWGNNPLTDDAPSPLYGFTRPYLKLTTVGVFNGLAGGIDFFPISFIGLSTEYEKIFNRTDYRNYDCISYRCQGNFGKFKLKGTFYYGLGPIGGQAIVQWKSIRQNGAQVQDFIENHTMLALNAAGDQVLQFQNFLIWRTSSTTSLGLSISRAFSERSHENHTWSYILPTYRPSQGDWKILFGIGRVKSTQLEEQFSTLVLFSWSFSPSYSLEDL